MRGLAAAIAASLVALAAPAFERPAAAADFTHDAIIGFSEDARYFAFSTFGLARGSGLPFANVFVVDLDRDRWVAGTPARARRTEEAMAEVEAAPLAALAQVREEALAAASPILRDLGVRRPASVLYARGIGEIHEGGPRARIALPHPDDPTRPPLDAFFLDLEPIRVAGGAEFCPEPEALRGYRLTRISAQGSRLVLHEDARIPASRGCPLAYHLDAVVAPGHLRDPRGVALISVWSQSFEGLSRHVIALPVPLRTR